MPYEVIIGMEVHAQVITQSKMFCACSADSASAPPNANTCPVCLGMPGALPVINEVAVRAAVLTGLALNCSIPDYAKFDRKNYTYPDLPKGYQISQYDLPFALGGWLNVPTADGGEKQIRVTRVHLEEDTAKLIHEGDSSLIDFNRAGMPLMEIVTEADIRSADEAWHYVTRLQRILRYLGVSTGNMEEGAMRCEANISLREVGAAEFGTKVEVKNLNSFRSVRSAIEYEIERQTHLLDHGERVVQVTMGWDENEHKTVFQRSKESSDDYRYFPEPDLPPIQWTEAQIEAIRQQLPELPEPKQARFMAEYDLKLSDAERLVQSRDLADYFEAVVKAAGGKITGQMAANWIIVELFRLLRGDNQDMSDIAVRPDGLAKLLLMVQSNQINNTVAKEVLDEMFSTGQAASAIVEARGLAQINDDDALSTAVREVIAAHPKPVQQYLDGEKKVIGFLMGQVMRATGGKANAQIVRQKLIDTLDG